MLAFPIFQSASARAGLSPSFNAMRAMHSPATSPLRANGLPIPPPTPLDSVEAGKAVALMVVEVPD